jgi:hypothetical protein
MGDKVSKIKKGITKNLVKAIEFDDSVDKVDAQEITDLVQVLTTSNNTSVTTFHITGPTLLTDELAKNVSIFFKSYHTDTNRVRVIRSLSIGFKKAKFESAGVNRIFQCLMYCDIVGELIITLESYNPFDQSNLETLRTLLLASETDSAEDNKCKLTKLTIGGFAVTPAIAKGLAQLMSKQQRVTHLSLVKWEMNAENVKFLFSEGNPFEYIDLSGDEIGDDACKAIADAFAAGYLNKLKKLILNDNSITEKGVQYLIEGIENSENGVITDIQLKNNNITDQQVLDKLTELLKQRGGEKHMTLTDEVNDSLKGRLATAVMNTTVNE